MVLDKSLAFYKFHGSVNIGVVLIAAMTIPSFGFLQLTSVRASIAMPNNTTHVEGTIVAPANVSNSVINSQTTVDGLIQEIAKLEVERALLEARYTLNSPVIQSVERKIKNARDRFVKLGGREATIDPVVSNSLKAKFASLEVEVALLHASYQRVAVEIQTPEEQLRILRDRYAKFQPRNPKITLNKAASKALRTKIAELKAERARLSAVYSPQSVEIASMDEKLRCLRERLAMYQ
jgi:chromosome segregation ATPase